MTRQFWLVGIMSFLFSFVVSTIFVHVVIAATDFGIASISAAAILTILGALWTVSQLTMGGITDKIGGMQTLFFGFILMTAAVLLLVFASELWMFYLFAGLFGLAIGCWVATPPLISDLFGLTSHGALIGFAFFCSKLGDTIGPVMAGRIYDISQSYQITWSILAAGSFITVLTLLYISKIGKPHLKLEEASNGVPPPRDSGDGVRLVSDNDE